MFEFNKSWQEYYLEAKQSKAGLLPTSPNLCFCTTWQKTNNEASFYTNAMLVLCQTSTNLINSWLILTLLYDSLILAINWFQLWATWGGGIAQENWSWVLHCSSWTVLHVQRASALSCWKTNCHLWCAWQQQTFAETVWYPSEWVSSFLTAHQHIIGHSVP